MSGQPGGATTTGTARRVALCLLSLTIGLLGAASVVNIAVRARVGMAAEVVGFGFMLAILAVAWSLCWWLVLLVVDDIRHKDRDWSWSTVGALAALGIATVLVMVFVP